MTNTYPRLFSLFLFLAYFSICISAQAQPENSDSLYVKEFVLAENVVEREPVNVVQSFDVSDKKAWCFARINNPSDIITLTFRWFHEDDLHYEMDTQIGKSPNWRTYSSVTLAEGTWRVELVSPENTVLKEIRFNVSG